MAVAVRFLGGELLDALSVVVGHSISTCCAGRRMVVTSSGTDNSDTCRPTHILRPQLSP